MNAMLTELAKIHLQYMKYVQNMQWKLWIKNKIKITGQYDQLLQIFSVQTAIWLSKWVSHYSLNLKV